MSTTGEKNPKARLTARQVKAIWEQIKKGVSYVQISKRYPVSANCISRIGRAETWTSITGLKKKKYRNKPSKKVV